MFVIHASVWDLLLACLGGMFMLLWFVIWASNTIQSYRNCK